MISELLPGMPRKSSTSVSKLYILPASDCLVASIHHVQLLTCYCVAMDGPVESRPALDENVAQQEGALAAHLQGGLLT